MRRSLLAVALTLAFAANAGELKGVKMPDTAEVAGKTLKLNGMGLRTKVFFKVYVAGLYLEQTSKDGKEILSRDEVREMSLAMLRDVDRKAMGEAIVKAVEGNSGNIAAFKDRLDGLVASMADLKEGQVFKLTYVPGQGTKLTSPGAKEFSAPGKDFADALFGAWLGDKPVDGGLKDGVLGK
jgi:Chalcone isomerase-like